MKIYQYADFLVKSVSVSADDVTAALGVKADQSLGAR